MRELAACKSSKPANARRQHGVGEMDGFVDRSAVLSKVETELVYLVPGSEQPRTFCYKLPPGVPHSNYTQERRRHFIHDGRPTAGDLALDMQGFVLIERPGEFTAFHDHD